MNEICDRCGPGVRAAVRAERAEQAEALYLCRHCGSRLWSALYARGWTMSPVSEHAFAPQAA
jgi:DNA-directed RNA polymerase subunit RPC12/RpoP